MTLPTLREVLALPAYAGAQVLGGENGLDAAVTWVHVSEVLDAARFLSGGELILSTGLELSRITPDAGAAYLRSLVDGGAHGLALELVGPLRDVPPAVVMEARRTDFPLIAFQHEVRFADLTRAALGRILVRGVPDVAGGLDSVTLALRETGRAAAFRDAHLGPLLALPDRPRGTLLTTLDALIAGGFNIAQVARTLGVRRQTVYYRLEQLRALLGDLDDPRRQLAWRLALDLGDGENDAGRA
ncbi:PucR family transcriptional regulator ligand-binding domain-containing protein [Deinococcus sp.]|uniref:PucR family transcriptional regulator n=1 Tax=Deinococcus sp. TaxID=47478 RepID=UPI002869D77A|nr:PucR family transcriptional regulator ligand-binding domain-containing protein [Deinococcus sp.]